MTTEIIIGIIYIIGAFLYYEKIKDESADASMDVIFWPIVLIFRLFDSFSKDKND